MLAFTTRKSERRVRFAAPDAGTSQSALDDWRSKPLKGRSPTFSLFPFLPGGDANETPHLTVGHHTIFAQASASGVERNRSQSRRDNGQI
ncbi:MAG: hypothetical protein ACE1ZA_06810, partial [Pseudomonadales bacterium]